MKNHKWQNNVCITCGLEREKRTVKTLMAMVGSRDIYKYEQKYFYSRPFKSGSFERPDCLQEQEGNK